jgi:hypothetical protein
MAYEQFIAPVIGALGSIVGGALGSRSQQETSKANIAAAERAQDKALGALTGGSAFQQTEQVGKGFQTTQPGGPDAAFSREQLASGDIERSLGVNALDRNFNFTLAGLPQASEVIAGENLRGQAQFQEGLDKIAKSRQRTSGGIHAPGGPFDRATMDAMYDYSEANPRGGVPAAIELLHRTQLGDLGVKDAHKASLARQAPAPGFTAGTGPGASAVQALTQMPLPRGVPDYTSSLVPYAISDVVSGVQAQAQRAEDMDRIERMYQNRYAQPGFVGMGDYGLD